MGTKKADIRLTPEQQEKARLTIKTKEATL